MGDTYSRADTGAHRREARRAAPLGTPTDRSTSRTQRDALVARTIQALRTASTLGQGRTRRKLA